MDSSIFGGFRVELKEHSNATSVYAHEAIKCVWYVIYYHNVVAAAACTCIIARFKLPVSEWLLIRSLLIRWMAVVIDSHWNK